MKNWSGYLQWQPETVAYPKTEAGVLQEVIKALEQRKKIRVIGTGHSFTPLCKNNEVMISLDEFQGLISVDKEKIQATVKAGTKLSLLGELLFEQGMAMANMGDIDSQSIAGTISTGTHGTGKRFGTMSTQVVAIRFINGQGEIVDCSVDERPDLFKAAQISLGTLGIITQITLQCVPAYRLILQNKKEALSHVLSTLEERYDQNRNFEFYWFPYTDAAWTKSSNIATDQPDKVSFMNYYSEYFIENYAFKLLCEVAYRFPSKNKWVSQLSADTIPDAKKVYQSHKIYATQRLVRFNEMEYNVPKEAHQEVLQEIIKAFNTKKFDIHFPIENRVVQRDDIYLSPAYQRDAAYIACHAYAKKDPKPYFKVLEEIFRAYEGRPHWGKMNTLEPKEISKLYPKFEMFLKHRQEQDPDKVFITPYLERLLGVLN